MIDDGSFFRGLSAEELERDRRCVALALSLRKDQCNNDEILSRLREAGYSRMSSLKAFVEIDGLSLPDAKVFICESPAWSDLPLPDYADALLELENFDDDAQ